MYAGAFLVVIGVLFLLQDFGFLTGIDWGIIWPVIFILLGISMMAKRGCNCGRCGWSWWGMNHHRECKCEDCGK